MTVSIKPYGTWQSPITIEQITQGTIGLGQTTLTKIGVYWLETRPQEGGRGVLMYRTHKGEIYEINSASYNIRTRVHEYGGGAYLVTDKDQIFFSHFDDQRLYKQELDSDPQPITPEGVYRYADGIYDKKHNRLIYIREEHSSDSKEPVNTIIGISLDGSNVTVLESGADFYATPRLSPDGNYLAWICWHHPNMPWDGTKLWIARIDDQGNLVEKIQVAGGNTESIFQPQWAPTGALYFISDRSNWWNLYRWDGEKAKAILPMKAEFGLPQWIFGQSTYGFISPHKILCTYSQESIHHLAYIDTQNGTLEKINTPYTGVSFLQANEQQAVFIGAASGLFPEIVTLDVKTGKCTTLHQSNSTKFDSETISYGEPISFPTGNHATAYGFFYPPKSKDFIGFETERPPLIVISHGGPTAATDNTLNLKIQYWTSRGFGVLDVNYRGSTNYGRAYRQQLIGQWGIADVEDCIYGAKYLVQHNRVDPKRLAIRGSSAGGFTTLAALTFYSLFKAGASYYGISDLEALAKDTHKFESRYLDQLIGAYPEQIQRYRDRSPIHSIDKIDCPIIFFQGLEDKVVPPNQAEAMVNLLKEKKLPVAYITFPDEQHGFRRAENISHALKSELYFYGKIFGFTPADELKPIYINNL
ncbi:S9 family peptidase [Candidatus Nitrosacidococcus tergens]|uniref:Peptidase S9 prolyl oligopeptidase active site domain protein n=1 Tax=Candidatus Nitrosacidococcus tergens TaxID=553981 RepID=A0A7G1QA38_9GAMM|nr:S9 family peptidase [Candidatus Nitrosacidococcus tergens]CAB1276095.1 Peptidase S9 prolyl oligopeptidase active site domain protein [Candidatus Nitrosacidococcus tergens]